MVSSLQIYGLQGSVDLCYHCQHHDITQHTDITDMGLAYVHHDVPRKCLLINFL